MPIQIDDTLKLFQDELNVLHQRIKHESKLDDFKFLQAEIKVLNDLVANIFKYKAIQLNVKKN